MISLKCRRERDRRRDGDREGYGGLNSRDLERGVVEGGRKGSILLHTLYIVLFLSSALKICTQTLK